MRSHASTLVALLVFAAAAFGVSRVQPALATTLHTTKVADDTVTLPPADQMKLVDLGYDAATVDFLWSKVLVEYGLHGHEKRVFNTLPSYLDAILALEPDYAPLYRYVDTLLVYRYPVGTEADARMARKYLERGIAARPSDHRVWMQYGQFLAFLAPSFLKDPQEIAEWRRDGAHAMSRAVELGGDADRSISAATLMTKSGERDAAIKSLRRAYALTETSENLREEHENIGRKLQSLEATSVKEAADRDLAFIEDQRRAAPYLSRGVFLMLYPAPNVLDCVGPGAPTSCARDWSPLLPSARTEDQ